MPNAIIGTWRRVIDERVYSDSRVQRINNNIYNKFETKKKLSLFPEL